MNTKEYKYSWHLSLRADRPVQGCPMRPHAYMYGKKLDERDLEKSLHQAHTKIMKDPPPNHEFSYRWFRGPVFDPCAYDHCTRRTSYSPHDWSKHALGGTDCAIQCVSTQSSLFKHNFCNSTCFVNAWKTQYTVPKDDRRSATPNRSRSASYGSNDDPILFDEAGSVRSSGSQSPAPEGTSFGASATTTTPTNPSTPRGHVGGYNGNNNSSSHSQNTPASSNPKQYTPSYSTGGDYNGGHNINNNNNTDEWTEISREQMFLPGDSDVGCKLKIEACAYSDSGELLMQRVVKTDVVLARAPDPRKRTLATTKQHSGPSGGPRFRVATYNVLAEIYATGQQYPYCDFWALSWEYRFHNILREIMDANPDVLCLQEIQADHYDTHVIGALHEAGYDGVFKQKTRQSMGLAGKVDGCALFWRRAKFHLVESYSIEVRYGVVGLGIARSTGSDWSQRNANDSMLPVFLIILIVLF